MFIEGPSTCPVLVQILAPTRPTTCPVLVQKINKQFQLQKSANSVEKKCLAPITTCQTFRFQKPPPDLFHDGPFLVGSKRGEHPVGDVPYPAFGLRWVSRVSPGPRLLLMQIATGAEAWFSKTGIR